METAQQERLIDGYSHPGFEIPLNAVGIDPKDHIKTRLLNSGSKAQGRGDSRNHGL